MMEDFNADNAKIDAAIRAAESSYIPLKSVTATNFANVSEIDFDLSDVNFGAWQYVVIDLHIMGSGYVNTLFSDEKYLLDGNGNKISTSIGTDVSYQHRLRFNCYGNPARRVTYTLDETYPYRHESITCGAMSVLKFPVATTSYYISAGSTLTVWGVK
jgi:hypothetical protein